MHTLLVLEVSPIFFSMINTQFPEHKRTETFLDVLNKTWHEWENGKTELKS
jgi:hypothetical protein